MWSHCPFNNCCWPNGCLRWSFGFLLPIRSDLKNSLPKIARVAHTTFTDINQAPISFIAKTGSR
ncbi:MAG: hypothetical protein CL532_08520 [Aestuariivita sp.]|nr:hypothetical protein [Aestuariivita sp.]